MRLRLHRIRNRMGHRLSHRIADLVPRSEHRIRQLSANAFHLSAAPPANTSGRRRVVLLSRNITPTARPCDGIRSRSSTTASGAISRKCPTTPPQSRIGRASTVNPSAVSSRARSRATSSFHETSRTFVTDLPYRTAPAQNKKASLGDAFCPSRTFSPTERPIPPRGCP